MNSTLSDEEIIEIIKKNPNGNWYEWPSWEEIVKRDAAKNYNNDEAVYNKQKNDSIKSTIDSWKKINIEFKKKNNISIQKQVDKLKTKLQNLI